MASAITGRRPMCIQWGLSFMLFLREICHLERIYSVPDSKSFLYGSQALHKSFSKLTGIPFSQKKVRQLTFSVELLFVN